MDGSGGQLQAFVFQRPAVDARSAAEKEFLELPVHARAGLLLKMEKYSGGRAVAGRDFKPLRDGIYEIRVKLGTNPYRVLFFLDGNQPVALRCFHKKDQKVSGSDIDVAVQRRKTWSSGSASNAP